MAAVDLASDVSAITFAQTQAPNNNATASSTVAGGTANASAAPVASTDGEVNTGITCFHCGFIGHYAPMCPNRVVNVTITQISYNMAQANNASYLNPSWILLDSQSTISVFCNPNMLLNIRRSDAPMCAVTNGGYQESHMMGDLPNLGPVWYKIVLRRPFYGRHGQLSTYMRHVV
jgi:hypothetical protein